MASTRRRVLGWAVADVQELANAPADGAGRPSQDLEKDGRPSQPTPRATPAKPGIKERLNALMAEYGTVALYVYFTIFGVVLVSFALAIQFGFKTDSTAATAGTWGAAWVATKLTQPLRIAATFLLTPIVGNVRRRLRGGAPRAPR